jgi:hypothetical protein
MKRPRCKIRLLLHIEIAILAALGLIRTEKTLRDASNVAA